MTRVEQGCAWMWLGYVSFLQWFPRLWEVLQVGIWQSKEVNQFWEEIGQVGGSMCFSSHMPSRCLADNVAYTKTHSFNVTSVGLYTTKCACRMRILRRNNQHSHSRNAAP